MRRSAHTRAGCNSGAGQSHAALFASAALALIFLLTVVLDPIGAFARPADSRPSLLLDKGSSGKFKWFGFTFRGGGPKGGKRPCISLITHSPSGEPGTVIEGGGVGCSRMVNPRRPVIVGSSDTAFGRSWTGVGLALPSLVTAVELQLRPVDPSSSGANRTRTIAPRLLSMRQANKAHIARRFRYAFFAVRGVVCIPKLTEYDAQGAVVYSADVDAGCP